MRGNRLAFSVEECDEDAVFVLGLLVVEGGGANGVCPGRFPIIELWLLVSADTDVFGLGGLLLAILRPRPPPPPEEDDANDR